VGLAQTRAERPNTEKDGVRAMPKPTVAKSRSEQLPRAAPRVVYSASPGVKMEIPDQMEGWQ
jgi:hypothetical protein